MKRLLFLVVSALITSASYASSLSKSVFVNATSKNEVSVSKQSQSLILERPAVAQDVVNGYHYSHSSHSSHSSHRSHYSSRF